MQTFLPYDNFHRCADVLDSRRLLKQCVEAHQLLTGEQLNHPASKMWSGYEDALQAYLAAMISGWRRRGLSTRGEEYTFKHDIKEPTYWERPPWLGVKPFHDVHKLNLIRKDPGYYLAQFQNELTVKDISRVELIVYLWPVMDNDGRLLGFRVGGGKDARFIEYRR